MNFHHSIRPLNAALLGTAAVSVIQLASVSPPLTNEQTVAFWVFSLSIPLMGAAGLAIERAVDEKHDLHDRAILFAGLGWLLSAGGFCALIESVQVWLGYTVFIIGSCLMMWVFQHGTVIPAAPPSTDVTRSPSEASPTSP